VVESGHRSFPLPGGVVVTEEKKSPLDVAKGLADKAFEGAKEAAGTAEKIAEKAAEKAKEVAGEAAEKLKGLKP